MRRKRRLLLLALLLLLTACSVGEREQTEGPVLWFCTGAGEHGPALSAQPYEGELEIGRASCRERV